MITGGAKPYPGQVNSGPLLGRETSGENMNRYFTIALLFSATALASTAAGAATSEPAEGLAADSTAVTSEAIEAPADGGDDPAAAVESSGTDAAPKDTEVTFMPYLWVAGTKGSIGIPKGSGEVDIDKSFTDILGSLKFAFMGALDVRHKRLVVLGDVIYLSVGATAESIRDPAFATGHVDARTFVGSMAAGYRLVDNGPLFLDVFAGGRVISLHGELDLEGPLATRHAEKSATTVAPLLGARFRAPIGRTWAFGLYADAGGFLKGSDVKWQFMANVQHDFSRHWGMLAGYRYMAIHHDSDRFDFDINLSGPILGFTYTF